MLTLGPAFTGSAVAALVFAAAGWRAFRHPRRLTSALPRAPKIVDVILESAPIGAAPTIWLKLAAGPEEHVVRVQVGERDTVVETDFTNPPSVRRYDAPTPVAAQANRVLWAAATGGPDAPAARRTANRLLTLIANGGEPFR